MKFLLEFFIFDEYNKGMRFRIMFNECKTNCLVTIYKNKDFYRRYSSLKY